MIRRIVHAILCGLERHYVRDVDGGYVECVRCGKTYDPMDIFF